MLRANDLPADRTIVEAHDIEALFEGVDVLTHDLRSALGILGGFAALLRDRGRSMDEERRDGILDSIATQSTVTLPLVAMIDDLLAGTKGSFAVLKGRHDLSEVLERVATDPRASLRAIALELDIPEPPEWVFVDRERLHHGLVAWIDAVSRWVPQGGRIALTARVAAGRVRIDIADDGQPIDAGSPPESMVVPGRDRRCGVAYHLLGLIARAHGGDAALVPGAEGRRLAIEFPRR